MTAEFLGITTHNGKERMTIQRNVTYYIIDTLTDQPIMQFEDINHAYQNRARLNDRTAYDNPNRYEVREYQLASGSGVVSNIDRQTGTLSAPETNPLEGLQAWLPIPEPCSDLIDIYAEQIKAQAKRMKMPMSDKQALMIAKSFV